MPQKVECAGFPQGNNPEEAEGRRERYLLPRAGNRTFDDEMVVDLSPVSPAETPDPNAPCQIEKYATAQSRIRFPLVTSPLHCKRCCRDVECTAVPVINNP